MSFLTPQDVFVTDGFPKHTYVPVDAGRQEKELKHGLEQKNKIISIAGPSKSGKTTLCRQVFGEFDTGECIYVTGDAIEKAEDLWRETYTKITDDADKSFFELTHSQRINKIVESGLTLVIDDFHYIPKEAQVAIAKQIKNAAFEGLRIVCLSVPHRGDDVVRGNPDLSGRYFSINFDYWTPTELAQIASQGFPKVGLAASPEYIAFLANEALKSPQIMQTLCLESCRIHGEDVPLESVIPLEMHIPQVREQALRSYNQATTLELLRKGPAIRGSDRNDYLLKDGTQKDVYTILLQAFRLSPPFQELTHEEIRGRVRSLLADDREPVIRSALQQYEGLFKEGRTPLEWDDEKRKLTVVDPHFLFYLRHVPRI